MTSVKQEYPKWLYHGSGASMIVADAAAHDKAGAWWFEDPIRAAAAVAQAAAAVTGAPAVAEAPPRPVGAAPPEGSDPLAVYYTAPLKQVVAKVASLTTLDDVAELRDIESQRPGGARKTVMTALAARRGALAPPVEAPV